MDLDELDLEAVDKEMIANEVAQSSQAAQNLIIAPERDTLGPGDAD